MVFVEPSIPDGFTEQYIYTNPILYTKFSKFPKNTDLIELMIFDRNGKMACHAKICTSNIGQLVVGIITVFSPHKGKGLASYIYDQVEYIFDAELHPSETLQDEGVEFWKRRIYKKQKQNPNRYQNVSHIELD